MNKSISYPPRDNDTRGGLHKRAISAIENILRSTTPNIRNLLNARITGGACVIAF